MMEHIQVRVLFICYLVTLMILLKKNNTRKKSKEEICIGDIPCLKFE